MYTLWRYPVPMSPVPKRAPRANGPDRWKVRFRLANGTNTSETFDTRDEAAEFCRDIDDVGTDAAVRLRSEAAPTAGAMRMDAVAEDFFTWKAARVRSDRTIADYRRDYRNWIKPTFGRKRPSSITDRDVQAWIDAMHGANPPAAPKSIADRHALLHAILERAIRLGQATTNPCVGTDLPKKQKGLPKGLRPAEWEALHAALVTIEPEAADVAEALLVTGWRWSELTALAVGQVEDTGSEMYVSMDRVVRRNAAGQNVIVEEGKGQASVRRVQIDPDAMPMFRRHLIGKAPGDLVFTTPISPQNGKGGTAWRHGNYVTRYWNPAVEAANLSRRPTVHWLRHTHVVWMVMGGASLAELQNRIGHASITTTMNVYGRMLTDVSPAALGNFAKMRRGSTALESLEG